jgi:hypothetical protein
LTVHILPKVHCKFDGTEIDGQQFDEMYGAETHGRVDDLHESMALISFVLGHRVTRATDTATKPHSNANHDHTLSDMIRRVREAELLLVAI